MSTAIDSQATAVRAQAARPPGVHRLDAADPDQRDLAGAVAVLAAAASLDEPRLPRPTVSGLLGLLRHGWDGEPPEAAVHRDGGGRVTGVLRVWLPARDNTHLGLVEIVVDPAARRRGTGRALFGAAIDRLRAAGRTRVMVECLDLAPAAGFLEAMGLDRGYVGVNREQDLTRLDTGRLGELAAEAERHAAGYDLTRIPGLTPIELRADVAALTAAINDAPTDALDVQDEVYTADRIAAFDTAQHARGRRLYRLIARHRTSGEPAGETVIGVDGENPWFCWQFDTSVVRAHRGHRLGLRLKLAMLDWLAEAEPQVRLIRTDNAESNGPMVRINELLGYRIVSTAAGWQGQA